MHMLTKAADKAIPKRKIPTKIFPPWWDKELEIQRKKTEIAYRKIAPNTIGEAQRRLEYNKHRNEYVKIQKRNKKKTWRAFAGDLETNKWGKCFRWLRKGSKIYEAPSALKKENGEHASTLRETLQYLLDTLIPSDRLTGQTLSAPRRTLLNHRAIDKEGVKNSIWRMSTRKPPGEDGISATILRRAWLVLGKEIAKLFEDLII